LIISARFWPKKTVQVCRRRSVNLFFLPAQVACLFRPENPTVALLRLLTFSTHSASWSSSLLSVWPTRTHTCPSQRSGPNFLFSFFFQGVFATSIQKNKETKINIIKFTFFASRTRFVAEIRKSEDHYLIFVSVGAMLQRLALKNWQAEGYFHLPIGLTGWAL